MEIKVGGQSGLPDLGAGRGRCGLALCISLFNPLSTAGSQRLPVILPPGPDLTLWTQLEASSSGDPLDPS